MSFEQTHETQPTSYQQPTTSSPDCGPPAPSDPASTDAGASGDGGGDAGITASALNHFVSASVDLPHIAVAADLAGGGSGHLLSAEIADGAGDSCVSSAATPGSDCGDAGAANATGDTAGDGALLDLTVGGAPNLLSLSIGDGAIDANVGAGSDSLGNGIGVAVDLGGSHLLTASLGDVDGGPLLNASVGDLTLDADAAIGSTTAIDIAAGLGDHAYDANVTVALDQVIPDLDLPVDTGAAPLLDMGDCSGILPTHDLVDHLHA